MSQEPVSKQSANASDRSISEQVSVPLRVAAAWSWRILIVIVTVSVIVWGLRYVASIVVAVLVALLLALLLAPLLSFLRGKLHMGKTSSAAVGLVSGLILVTGLMAIALGQVVVQLPALVSQTLGGLDDLLAWVQDGPLGLDFAFLDGFLESFQDDLTSVLRNYGGVIASEAWSFATSAVSLAASALIALFTLFFMLKDGRSMWIWFLRCLPKQWREQTNEAGIRGWVTLGSYIRTQLKVAGIDAIGIGLGAFALGVPAAIPIMVLVFFFSFIPIVGAFISGAVAVLLALVNNGLTSAIIMLVVVLAVQQIESNVLQPWLMSNAVSLHPVAVVLAVTAGSAVAGIVGAIFAVPLLAFINVTLMYLHGHDMFPELATDEDRPGGPPGSLQEQITASYWTAHRVKKGSGKKGNADAGRVEVEQAIVAGPEVSGAP
ncbi:AI-2E family transporter [Schaalia sp. JY-X169]|uniref:AI-2E family transporter n=1 Tax=Schaalia sp. JY-X169 TaxID=2758572 RepID=UPI0015F69547|nr:AI-2E family transporter [Schaalia sp. JY-X169]